MAKTNPIGVRFKQENLDYLKKEHGVDSPQKALVFYERFFMQHHKLAKDSLRDEKVFPKPDAQIKAEGAEKAAKADLKMSLGQLKGLCPKELTGFDRSQWIANERQKYGI